MSRFLPGEMGWKFRQFVSLDQFVLGDSNKIERNRLVISSKRVNLQY